MTACIHGLDTANCTYCNGDYYAKTAIRQTVAREREEASLEKQKYDLMKNKFDNFFEDWEESEYQVVHDHLDGLRFRSAKWRKAVYAAAIALGRTRKAIVWKAYYIFGTDSSPKAGKNLLAFRNKLNVNKEEGVANA